MAEGFELEPWLNILGLQRCQVDVIRVRTLVWLYGTIHTLIQVDGCAADADGHQRGRGKRCARCRGGSGIGHGLQSNKQEHLMKQWPVEMTKKLCLNLSAGPGGV